MAGVDYKVSSFSLCFTFLSNTAYICKPSFSPFFLKHVCKAMVIHPHVFPFLWVGFNNHPCFTNGELRSSILQGTNKTLPRDGGIRLDPHGDSDESPQLGDINHQWLVDGGLLYPPIGPTTWWWLIVPKKNPVTINVFLECSSPSNPDLPVNCSEWSFIPCFNNHYYIPCHPPEKSLTESTELYPIESLYILLIYPINGPWNPSNQQGF